MNERYKITAYHCRSCGGEVEPGKRCRYCGKLARFAYDRRKMLNRSRILVDCGQDFVYLDDIRDLVCKKQIVTSNLCTLNGTFQMFNREECEITVNLYPSERGRELYRMLNREIYNTRLELLDNDRAFELKSYLSSIESDIFGETTLTFVQQDAMKMFNTVVPDGCTCPNCGAPVISRYGACDYCGGWIEWEFQ